MSYWLIPPFGYCLMMPMATMECIPGPLESDNLAKVSEQNINTSNSIKLNISRQDLIKAGYNHRRNTWSEEQDKMLLKLAKVQNLNWKQIGKKMSNRNSKMCYSRYRRLCYETKKRWTSREERTILEYIGIFGEDWKKIAEKIPERTARQIQQHYEFCLKQDLNKSEWTIEQDLLVVNLLERYGSNWKLIEEIMKNRTENQIKNRYFGRLLKISQQKIQKQGD